MASVDELLLAGEEGIKKAGRVMVVRVLQNGEEDVATWDTAVDDTAAGTLKAKGRSAFAEEVFAAVRRSSEQCLPMVNSRLRTALRSSCTKLRLIQR